MCFYCLSLVSTVSKADTTPLKKAHIVMPVTDVLHADAAMGENVFYSFFLSNWLFYFRVTGTESMHALGFFICLLHFSNNKSTPVEKNWMNAKKRRLKIESCTNYCDSTGIFNEYLKVFWVSTISLTSTVRISNRTFFFFSWTLAQSFCFYCLMCHCHSACLKLFEKWQLSLKCCLAQF